MKVRVITGVLVTLTAAALLIPGYKYPMIPLMFFLVVAVACIIEVTSVIRIKLPDMNQAIAVTGTLGILIPLIPVFAHGSPGWGFIRDIKPSSPNKLAIEKEEIFRYVTESAAYLIVFFVIFTFIAVIYLLSTKGPSHVLEAVLIPISAVYIVFPFSCAVVLLFIIPNGFLWMLAAFIAAWISDVFAFFTGVTLGKHKIVPLIRPKKTWEGTIGGVLGAVMAITFWMSVVMKGPDILVKSDIYLVSFGVVTGLLASLASQFGDWFASAVKRMAGVKDFGSLLPGHGGLLDRFDGVLFAFPTILAAALIYYLI